MDFDYGQRGRSVATAPPALDGPSPIPQPGALKLSTQVDLRYFCDRLYIRVGDVDMEPDT